jgi:AcrR family transcriptional regulator
VTLRAVAGAVGVAPALIAHYVSSMDEVVADAFAAIVAEELAEMEGIAAGREDPAAATRAVLEALLDEDRRDVTLVWVQSWAFGRRNGSLAGRVRHATDDWRAFLSGLVARGVGAGVFRTRDADTVAAQLLAMIDGLNAHSLVGWQGGPTRLGLLLRSVEVLVEAEPGSLG